jgi:NADP-dependent 3-hydroxy acid dehydrogenase YdfG
MKITKDGMKKSMSDKVVCITGAGRGIGRAIAEAFAAEGASLVLGARTTPEIDELASTLENAIALQTDVRRVLDVERLVEGALAQFGRLDVMVNNAGTASFGPFEGVTETEFDDMMDTNAKGAFFGSQAAFRVMKAQRSGLIVNVAGMAGRQHLPNQSAYNASKWALVGFTGALREEAAWYGVRVTCLFPDCVDTGLWKTQDFLPFSDDEVDPSRDFLPPESVARVLLDLARAGEQVLVPEVMVTPLLARKN